MDASRPAPKRASVSVRVSRFIGVWGLGFSVRRTRARISKGYIGCRNLNPELTLHPITPQTPRNQRQHEPSASGLEVVSALGHLRRKHLHLRAVVLFCKAKNSSCRVKGLALTGCLLSSCGILPFTVVGHIKSVRLRFCGAVILS